MKNFMTLTIIYLKVYLKIETPSDIFYSICKEIFTRKKLLIWEISPWDHYIATNRTQILHLVIYFNQPLKRYTWRPLALSLTRAKK